MQRFASSSDHKIKNSMRNTVRFNSEKFNSSEPKDYFINPCCFGDDVGQWLRPRLEALGYRTCGPEQEDWGWYLECARDGVTHTLNIGHIDEPDGCWQIVLERPRSLVDRLLGRNSAIDSQLAADIDAILGGDP